MHVDPCLVCMHRVEQVLAGLWLGQGGVRYTGSPYDCSSGSSISCSTCISACCGHGNPNYKINNGNTKYKVNNHQIHKYI